MPSSFFRLGEEPTGEKIVPSKVVPSNKATCRCHAVTNKVHSAENFELLGGLQGGPPDRAASVSPKV